MAPSSDPSAQILSRLFAVIRSRRGGDPASSYTASLFADGRAEIARKVGEEALETVIDALQGNKARVAEESADLLYHLLVLWAEMGLAPEDIWALLEAREGKPGKRD